MRDYHSGDCIGDASGQKKQLIFEDNLDSWVQKRYKLLMLLFYLFK